MYRRTEGGHPGELQIIHSQPCFSRQDPSAQKPVLQQGEGCTGVGHAMHMGSTYRCREGGEHSTELRVLNLKGFCKPVQVSQKGIKLMINFTPHMTAPYLGANNLCNFILVLFSFLSGHGEWVLIDVIG